MLVRSSRLCRIAVRDSRSYHNSGSGQRASPPGRNLLVATAPIAAFALLYLYGRDVLHADSQGIGYEAQSQLHGGKSGSIRPNVFIWGSNEHKVAAPEIETEVIKKPRLVRHFEGKLLRDLVLHRSHGVAVDEKGNVIQWGKSFSASNPETPRTTLKNQNIVRVVAGDDKIYALSKSGKVFIFPVSEEAQRLGHGGKRRSSWNIFWTTDYGTDFEELTTDSKLASGERFASISAGSNHVLALSNRGRAFAVPMSLDANTHGQLGVRRISLLSLHPSSVSSGARLVTMAPDPKINDDRRDLAPPPKLDPLLTPSGRGKLPEPVPLPHRNLSAPVIDPASEGPVRLSDHEEEHTALEKDIRFCTVLHELPALRGVNLVELVAGARHSLARTAEGRVIGWGANGYGQLGLGPSLAIQSIPAPTEIPLIKCYPKSTNILCQKIAAGGNLSYFIVERRDVADGRLYIDLLATGNGQFGGIGNGTWAHAASPVRVKTISGLQEWNESSQSVEPISIRDLTVGKTHIAVALDNAVEQANGIKFGRDVFVFGHNEWFQLGTGKRSNLSTPQHLSPLPYPGLTELPPESVTSGTLSPMPHSRLQLAPELLVNGKRVEETIVAGDGSTAVYWRILEP